MENILIVLL